MGITDRNLIQDATLWVTTGSNGYGGYDFNTPQAIKVRWLTKRKLFINFGGEEETSNSEVYCAVDMAVGDYLYLGTSTETDPTSISGAFQVKAFEKIPSLRNLEILRSALL